LLVLLLNPLTLEWIASRYVVDDRMEHADALVALRSDATQQKVRIDEAAQLFRERYASLFLLDVYEGSIYDHPESELAADYVKRRGVPKEQTRNCENVADSTAEETVALRSCLERIGAKSVIVVTSEFHTRRSRLLFQHAFSGSGITVGLHPVYDPKYWDSHWWRKRRWAKTFFDETIKIVWAVLEQWTASLLHSLPQKPGASAPVSEPRPRTVEEPTPAQ